MCWITCQCNAQLGYTIGSPEPIFSEMVCLFVSTKISIFQQRPCGMSTHGCQRSRDFRCCTWYVWFTMVAFEVGCILLSLQNGLFGSVINIWIECSGHFWLVQKNEEMEKYRAKFVGTQADRDKVFGLFLLLKRSSYGCGGYSHPLSRPFPWPRTHSCSHFPRWSWS